MRFMYAYLDEITFRGFVEKFTGALGPPFFVVVEIFISRRQVSKAVPKELFLFGFSLALDVVKEP
ncbi:hypothetical protein ATC05_18350 [Pseudomonas aeruginosa]|nr:hypothetical protein ATC05_18350 [Pseudomonas aeruginosa]